MHEQWMKDGNAGTDEMDGRMARALERAPEVNIPAGFAARVAGQLPARREIDVTPARYGLIAMRIAMAVLVLALVILAMRSPDRSALGVALEWILCAQLAALAIWLGGERSLGAPET